MTSLFDKYDFPKDLKHLSKNEAELLAIDIRSFLIESLSKTGGHLSSNLGIVELTIALHKAFNIEKDKVVWDVGHQAYVHKILTGRGERFNTLRKFQGLSGFPKVCEYEFDQFDTGHASNSISLATGLASARDIKGEDYNVVAVIGDGSLTGGMAYEAMNNAGQLKSKLIVVLNDNGMSISPNVGGVSEHLYNLRTSVQYQNAKTAIKSTIRKIPKVGNSISENIANAKERLKYALIPSGIIFEELGFKYMGPIDGHNLSELDKAFESAKNIDGPVLLHIITKKGKGYKNAELHPLEFHGVSSFDKETGKSLSKKEYSYSNAFGDIMVHLGHENDKIVGISAAMCEATGLGKFRDVFPNRFFDVGIAEAHGVSFAAGLARAGLRPVVAIYSSFLQRAYDQILEDVCLQNLPVVFAIDRAGIVGADGETHHGIFDMSYLSQMPNMALLTPSSSKELASQLKYALYEHKGPIAIRYPKDTCDHLESLDDIPAFNMKNSIISRSNEVEIWACGRMIRQAREAVEILKCQGIQAGLVSVSAIKPMDLSVYDKNIKYIFTLEDNILTGGFGEQLSSALRDYGTKVINMGWPDEFIVHGDYDNLFRLHGLDGNSIAENIKTFLK